MTIEILPDRDQSGRWINRTICPWSLVSSQLLSVGRGDAASHCATLIRYRDTPAEIAPNVAPFLPAVRAPTAVPIPAAPATSSASLCHDLRRPPPTRMILAFIVVTS